MADVPVKKRECPSRLPLNLNCNSSLSLQLAGLPQQILHSAKSLQVNELIFKSKYCSVYVYRWSLTYDGLTCIFQLYDGAKAICVHWKAFFKFWILTFPQLAVCHRILCCDAGLWQQGAAPTKPCDHLGKQPIHLTTIQSIHLYYFSVLIQYLVHNMR